MDSDTFWHIKIVFDFSNEFIQRVKSSFDQTFKMELAEKIQSNGECAVQNVHIAAGIVKWHKFPMTTNEKNVSERTWALIYSLQFTNDFGEFKFCEFVRAQTCHLFHLHWIFINKNGAPFFCPSSENEL